MSSEGARTVLLLHGQPGSARDWDLVVGAIAARAPVVAIDRPGWDGHTPPGDLATSARAAAEALEAAGASGATVAGLSFGGAVAAWLAVERPELVGSLVLIAPAANRDSLQPVDRLLAAPVVGYIASAAVLSGAALALTSGRIRRRLESAFSLPDDYLLATARRLRGPAAWNSFVVEQRALLRDLPILEGRLGRIEAPTTVVIGTSDTVVPVEAGRRLARQIPDARLVEISGGHHVLPAEHPERLAELILAAGRSDPTGAAPAGLSA
jgi:pimeloyl-ACP methyl ester carboxylesterase